MFVYCILFNAFELRTYITLVYYSMCYYMFRLTIPLLDEDCDTREKSAKFYPFFKLLIDKKVEPSEPYVLGYETLDKYGDLAKPHFHFHFICVDGKETLRTWIKNNFARMFSINLKGKMYCLSHDNEPDDVEAWVRYPMKEVYIKRFFNFDYVDKETAKTWAHTAKAEMIRRHVNNNKQRDKEREKKTKYDRIVLNLDEFFDCSGAIVERNYRNVWEKIWNFYSDIEPAPLNIQTM